MNLSDMKKALTAEELILKYNLDGLKTDRQNIKTNKELLDKSDTLIKEFVKQTIKDIEEIKSQVDGSITTWFFDGVPTNENMPASEWTTNEIKNTHIGDLYYDKETGNSYRYILENEEYKWLKIVDSDISQALAIANAAQDTADSKRRVFVTTPEPPYDVGDIWLKEDKDLYRCRASKKAGAYNTVDWIKATDYSNDDYAKNVEAVLNQFKSKVEKDYATKVSLETTKDSIIGRVESESTKTETKIIGYLNPTVEIESNKNIYINDAKERSAIEYIVYGKTIATLNGYQLFDSSRILTTNNNGVSLINNNDGSITINGNGASSGIFNVYYDLNYEEMKRAFKPGAIYLSASSATNPYVYIELRNSEGIIKSCSNKNVILSSFNITNDDLNNSANFIRIGFYTQNNFGNISNTTIKPMIYQEGDGTYEPFTNYEPAPNENFTVEPISITNPTINIISKNLLDTNLWSHKSDATLNFEIEEDGKINITGVNTSSNNVNKNISFFFDKEQLGKTYTLWVKGDFEGIGNIGFKRYGDNISQNLLLYPNQDKISTTFTVTEDIINKCNNFDIYIPLNDNVNASFYLQLEEGEKSNFEKFTKRSVNVDLKGNELCSVGDIKDFLEVSHGHAMIIKKIGKIDSYNNENIKGEFISSTGNLSIGATILYVLDESISIELDDLDLFLYNGNNKIELDTEINTNTYIKYLKNSIDFATKLELSETNNDIENTNKNLNDFQININNNYYTKDELDSMNLNIIEDVTKVINTVENLTTSTEHSINVIEERLKNGVSEVRTETGYIFNKEGLNISKTGEPVGSILNESGLEIIDKTGSQEETQLYTGYVNASIANKTSELAKYQGQTVTYAKNFLFEQFFSSPNWRIEEFYDETYGIGLGLFYVGGDN